MPPEICPQCGAEVPPRAQSCPECGADEETGWNDRAVTQRLGVSDPDDFDADEYHRNESGRVERRTLPWYWLAVALLVLAALVWMVVPH